MNYIKISKHDTSNGVGVRVVLWVSGCSLHCPGCHNQEAQDPDTGCEFTAESMAELIEALDKPYITGLTVSGGHPLEPYNCDEVYQILSRVRSVLPDKTIWLYTGYKWEEALQMHCGGTSPVDVISLCDVVVDGAYEADKRNITLAWRGSSNQRVINAQESLRQNRAILQCE